MMYFLFLIIPSIFLCLSDDYISLNYFEKKTLNFNANQTFLIFQFYQTYYSYFISYSTFSVFVSQIGPINHCIYIYFDKNNIAQDSNGNFINYLYKGYLNDKERAYSPENSKLGTGDIYFVLQNLDKSEVNTTILLSSPGPVTYPVGDFFFNQFNYYADNIYYKFDTSNKPRYLKIGYKHMNGTGSASFYLKSSYNYDLYERINISDFEETFKLDDDTNAIINIELKQNKMSFNSFYTYIIASDYPNIMPVEINTKNFQIIPLISQIDILLDIETLKTDESILIEYNCEWENETLRAEGYETSDLDYINSRTGVRLEIIDNFDEKNNNICKKYITKSTKTLKKVSLIVKKHKTKDIYYFHIRYSKSEPKKIDDNGEESNNGFYYDYNKIIPFIIGIVLSLPNIIWFFCKFKKGRENVTFSSLITNIIVHFMYSFIFFKNYIFLFIILLIFFAIFIIISLLFTFGIKRPSFVFASFKYLNGNLEDLKTLQESFDFNKKFPIIKKIKVEGYYEESQESWEKREKYSAIEVEERDVYHLDLHDFVKRQIIKPVEKERIVDSHSSSWVRTKYGGGKVENGKEYEKQGFKRHIYKNEVKNWEKEVEYEYRSWQDNTKINFDMIKNDFQIFDVYYSYKIDLDRKAEYAIEYLKNNLKNEGMENDCEIFKFFESDSCFGMMNREKCYADEKTIEKLKKIYNSQKTKLFWYICFILGYSSILETFLIIEKGVLNIEFTKSISGSNDYRKGYKENDDFSIVNYQQSKEDYSSDYYFSYVNQESLSRRRKTNNPAKKSNI